MEFHGSPDAPPYRQAKQRRPADGSPRSITAETGPIEETNGAATESNAT